MITVPQTKNELLGWLLKMTPGERYFLRFEFGDADTKIASKIVEYLQDGSIWMLDFDITFAQKGDWIRKNTLLGFHSNLYRDLNLNKHEPIKIKS